MSKRSEISYFAQDDLWSRSAVSEQVAVAEDLIELIPGSVNTILDAGCGNGTVTNRLTPRWDVVGCDISEAAVKRVQAPALVADLCAIPFGDRSFDLTLSSDVIEHLPDSIYAQALAEIARVSSRYILVAVPYRELLKAAEITCPDCGLHYHAHLHQRSYTVEDAVSLFAPTFSAIDVRFSGESWTFEDPNIVEASRVLSGLDYPFEDGVCPNCSSRRGVVERPSSALMVQRRFEALQAMQSAEGLRRMPDTSEILVLFERGAATMANWTSPVDATLFNEPTLALSGLALRDNPFNYPRGAYRIQGDADYGIVAIPRRPQSVQVEVGTLEALEVYDHVRGRYVNCPQGNEAGVYRVTSVPFGPHGCILRMLHPSDDLLWRMTFETADQNTITACCLGDDPTIAQMRDESSRFLALTEQLEITRSALENKLQEKERALLEQTQAMAKVNTLANELEGKRAELEDRYTQLSERASNQEVLLSTHESRVEELSRENEQLSSRLANFQAELDNAEQQEAACRLQIGELTLKLEQVSSLANALEVRRDALEQELQSRDQQLKSLQDLYDAALFQKEHWIEKTIDFEHKQHELTLTIEALESEVNQAQIVMLEYQNAVERIDVLELEKTTLGLELESLNMEVSARSHELAEKQRVAQHLNDLSERLESQREMLEAKVKNLGLTINSLAEEKTEYQMLVDALHIRLGQGLHGEAKQPRKVLVLSHMYPREYNMVGGIFVHEQVKALRAQGIDARVVSGEPFWINTINPKAIKRALDIYRAQKVCEWEEHEGVPLICFPYIVSSLLPFQAHATTYTHGLMRYAEWLRADFEFELIHAHTAYTDGTAGRRLASKLNIPLVITEHTGPFTTLTRTRYLRRMTQKALNAADKVIAVSSALLWDIRQQVKLKAGVDTQVIANLVDTELFNEQATQRGELIHLLWVGHFVPVKRVPVLLEAFAAAFQQEPRLRLRLAGSGEGLEDAQALVQSLGIAQVVEFSGRASRTQLVDYYRECDFLVISSESETFGVVAIEAMSCGRPVLTTRCGGPAEIVSHPQLGHVVGMSAQELTQGMLAMAQQRGAFNSKVIRKVTELKFSSASIAQEIANVYSTSIDNRRR
ncbi:MULTISPECIES: glycosyltransferase [Pseudomonas]|uniref:glycosyltransferase n=1 Tax=Pseudomonas TaxID=286 RepID=UPI00031ED5AF|nr:MULTISPECIES: glycosyltransferase [Pseudomonas]PJH86460.1 hypothetical protein CVG87_24350 [Pseudomonas sp. WCS365]ROM89510.1 hypothetical protein BK656_27680 [Pseudomonas brassicacearum]RON00667.1 hypothetical protein BK657_19180 [Pseudomonas brassicacearum]UII14493.1 D-inositol-3-phosphate glycosyltransferase [Pseudomonas brassicacearum]